MHRTPRRPNAAGFCVLLPCTAYYRQLPPQPPFRTSLHSIVGRELTYGTITIRVSEQFQLTAAAYALHCVLRTDCTRTAYWLRRRGQYAVPQCAVSQRDSLYIISMSSSYMGSASPLPARMAEVAQCLRWFRMSSRPTARRASWTEEICVMMSAQ